MSRLEVRIPLPTIFLLIGINVLWAGSSLAAKIALANIPPMTLAFARFALAALLIYGLALALKVDLRVARRDWGAFWAMGMLGIGLTYILSYSGLRLTTVSDSALLHATETVFLSLMAWFFLHEVMSRMKVAGILAGLVGVFLIIANGWKVPLLTGMVEGNLLIALGLIFEAGSSIVGKNLVARYPALTVVTYQMLSGAIALAPFSLLEISKLSAAGHPLAGISASALLSLLYLILPCTVLGYTIWFMILDQRQPGEMSLFLFIQPVVGAILGAVFQGDSITKFTITGAFLVMLGIGLVHRRSALPKSPLLIPGL